MNDVTDKHGISARHSRTGGFTLVETLVALVVVSVGMLGIAAMYVEGLRAGRTSTYRTVAIDLASDMADRIRANPGTGAAYNGAGLGVDNACIHDGPANCATPVVLADADTFVWQRDVRALLPGGTASVIVANAGVVNAYTISVSWIEPGTAQPLTYTLSMQAL